MSLTYGFCLDELSSMYDSAQFSDAFHAIVGDGITPVGAQFSVTISGFTATVASGYALAKGRWVSNDEPLPMTIQPSGNNDDRTDALVVRVDYQARKAALEVLMDVDQTKIRDDLTTIRDGQEYSIILCFIRVPRGASTLTPENVTDVRNDPTLCGALLPLSSIAGDVLYVYNFLLSGIDKEVARVIALSQAVVDKADTAIPVLDAAIQRVGGGPAVGELQTVRNAPGSGWLLCDGEPVPTEYPALSIMMGGTLPNITRESDRYRTYIYGGEPQ